LPDALIVSGIKQLISTADCSAAHAEGLQSCAVTKMTNGRIKGNQSEDRGVVAPCLRLAQWRILAPQTRFLWRVKTQTCRMRLNLSGAIDPPKGRTTNCGGL